MTNVFSYLNSPPATVPAGAQHITQQDESGRAASPPPEVETFDEAAEEDPFDIGDGRGGGWILPDPGTFPGREPPRTPLDHLAAVAAHAGTTRTQVHEGIGEATPPGPVLGNINQHGGDFSAEVATGGQATGPSCQNSAVASALIATCHNDGTIKTTADLIAFLDWQSSRRGEVEEQKRFREDALAFPSLLVFATMRKKSPFIYLVHSAGVYPNIPGADQAWKGKAVGFLGDKTRFANPQMIELGKTVAWAWDDPAICRDTTAMKAHYDRPANKEKFWAPPGDAVRVRTVCPRMLALPPDCVAFCAEERRTPAQLLGHITNTLEASGIDPCHYELALDWCCMAAHAGTGANATSSILSFAMPAVLGSSEHLHEWAHHRLALTLTSPTSKKANHDSSQLSQAQQSPRNFGSRPSGTAVEVGLLAQVTAAVVAAFRAGNGVDSTETPARGTGRTSDEPKAYSEYQLAKLKGFCCVRNESGLPPIWEYFRSTKEVDAQRAKLVESMQSWAKNHDAQINRGVYFDKSTMDEIVKLEFCPGTPTAYLNTAEQGMSLLICRPRTGNETADIRSKEHAMQLTAQNHTLAEALLLNKRDPRPPAANYHELKLDLGTFCALLWVLFGEKCDYFENCFALLNMLDSDSVFANAKSFTPLVCRQITWAVINDSRQYFFRVVTADHFASGRVRWPTSLLMQIIGADIQACRGISMGNFPSKWLDSATVGSYIRQPSEKRESSQGAAPFAVPIGLPPSPGYQWAPLPGTQQVATPDNTASGQGSKPVTIRPFDVHPQFKKLMSPYITHFRSVQLNGLLRAANLTEADLPVLPKYVTNGHNGLCYAYVLGKCQGKRCGKAGHGHAPVGDITDDFAKALCGRLGPAVEHRLRTEPPTPHGPYSGGHPQKRYKRTA